jgi:Nitrile hydratase, alpha chain
MADKRMQYNQIVAKAWGNEMFRRKLLKDPAGTLRDEGVDLPKGVEVKVVEDTPGRIHFILPVKPAGQVDAAVDFVVC